MTITYENTPEDALNFYACWLKGTRAGRNYLQRVRFIRAFCMTLLAFLIPFLLSIVFTFSIPLPGVISLAVVSGAIGYLAGNIDFKRMTRRITQQQIRSGSLAMFLGRKDTSITPEGLRVIWAEGEVLRRWSSLQRVEENDSHLLLIFGESDFSTIPKRAFRDAVHQQEFQATIERFRMGVSIITTGSSSSSSTSTGAPWWRNRSAVDSVDEKSTLRQGRS
jgi:hypothetical protein